MRSLFAAIQFLTMLPFPSGFVCGEKELRRSVIFFPLVGVLIGAMLALFGLGIGMLFPPLPASVLIVIAMLAVSGCLHMDGLADTADGFLSARSRERVLEIMKDSRIGSMGVIAIVGVIALKVACLASAPECSIWRVAFLMPVAGRCMLVLGMALGPYARPQGGLASAFGRPHWTATATALLVLAGGGWLLLGWAGVTSGILALVTTALLALWSQRKIGGFTGDTLGAACEIAEVAPVLAAACLRWPQ